MTRVDETWTIDPATRHWTVNQSTIVHRISVSSIDSLVQQSSTGIQSQRPINQSQLIRYTRLLARHYILHLQQGIHGKEDLMVTAFVYIFSKGWLNRCWVLMSWVSNRLRDLDNRSIHHAINCYDCERVMMPDVIDWSLLVYKFSNFLTNHLPLTAVTHDSLSKVLTDLQFYNLHQPTIRKQEVQRIQF